MMRIVQETHLPPHHLVEHTRATTAELTDRGEEPIEFSGGAYRIV